MWKQLPCGSFVVVLGGVLSGLGVPLVLHGLKVVWLHASAWNMYCVIALAVESYLHLCRQR